MSTRPDVVLVRKPGGVPRRLEVGGVEVRGVQSVTVEYPPNDLPKVRVVIVPRRFEEREEP